MITISKTIKKVACAVLTAVLVVTGVVGPQKVNALNNGATGSEIARGFLTSAEYTNKNVSDESFVSTLYNALLDRAPDQHGYDGWVAALKNGNSRINVLNSFMGAQEFKDVCARYNVRP